MCNRGPVTSVLWLLLAVSQPAVAAVDCDWAPPLALFTQDPDSGVRLHHLIGALHEHSAYSDGSPGTTPAHYYDAGRGSCLDFVAGAEHSDRQHAADAGRGDCVKLLNNPGSASEEARAACLQIDATSARTHWDAHRTQAADASSIDAFTAIRGFEWTNDEQNHVSVYFSSNQFAARSDGRYLPMQDFWDWLLKPASEGGGSDGLATFNHPAGAVFDGGRPSARPNQAGFNPHEQAGAENWEQFRYQPAADPQMVAVELFNSLEGGKREFLHGYHGLLDQGWHVGAVAGEDEHGTSWGSRCLPKTVLIARDASIEALRHALEQRRAYALAGERCDEGKASSGPPLQHLRMDFRMLGLEIPRPMGSRLSTARQTALLQGRIYWPGAHGYRLELVGNGGKVIASVDNKSLLERAVEVRPEERWYYLRVVELAASPPDGTATMETNAEGRLLAVSSPIWLHGEDRDQTVERGNPWLDRRILNVALRGGAREAPENTLYAYRRALQTGATAVHVELQETRDQQFVAMRAADVRETTNGKGSVSEMSLAEIQALDAAYWYLPGQGTVHGEAADHYPLRGIATGDKPAISGYRQQDFRVPSLEQLLQVLPDVPLLIELKPGPLDRSGQQERLAAMLQQAGRDDDVLLLTFLGTTLQQMRATAPALNSALPSADIAAFLAPGPAGRPELASGHQALLLPAERILRDDPALGRAREAGLATLAWAVASCEQMRRLLAGGVDGIASERPAMLAWVLRNDAIDSCELE